MSRTAPLSSFPQWAPTSHLALLADGKGGREQTEEDDRKMEEEKGGKARKGRGHRFVRIERMLSRVYIGWKEGGILRRVIIDILANGPVVLFNALLHCIPSIR